MLQPDPKMTAKVTFKSLGLKWLCPHTETTTALCLSSPICEASHLTFTAIIPRQQRKLRLQAQVLGKASPRARDRGFPPDASQPAGSDLDAGICRAQEHHVPSRARLGMLAGCPTGAVLAAGTGSPVAGLAGGEWVRGRSRGVTCLQGL